MKKITAIVLGVLMTIAALSGCAAKTEKTMYEQGLSLIAIMEEMGKSDLYHATMTSSDTVIGKLEAIRTGDFSKPDTVYTIALSEDYIAMMSEWEEMPEISDTLKDVLNTKLIGAFATQINALAGAETLAASAVCAAGKTFVDESCKENMMYLYVFEEGVPAAVTFVPGEGGAVSASGTFILYGGVDFSDENARRDFFAGMGAEIKVLEQ